MPSRGLLWLVIPTQVRRSPRVVKKVSNFPRTSDEKEKEKEQQRQYYLKKRKAPGQHWPKTIDNPVGDPRCLYSEAKKAVTGKGEHKTKTMCEQCEEFVCLACFKIYHEQARIPGLDFGPVLINRHVKHRRWLTAEP